MTLPGPLQNISHAAAFFHVRRWLRMLAPTGGSREPRPHPLKTDVRGGGTGICDSAYRCHTSCEKDDRCGCDGEETCDDTAPLRTNKGALDLCGIVVVRMIAPGTRRVTHRLHAHACTWAQIRPRLGPAFLRTRQRMLHSLPVALLHSDDIDVDLSRLITTLNSNVRVDASANGRDDNLMWIAALF